MIEVTLLGTGSPIPDARRAGPSTLVRAGSQTFLIDCGRGVQQRMTAAGVGANGLTALLLTHLHSDHIADLGDLIITRWVTTFTPEPNPLRIIGPPGTAEVVDATLKAFRFDIEKEATIQNVDNPAASVTLLMADRADAALSWEPNITTGLMKKPDLRVILKAGDVYRRLSGGLELPYFGVAIRKELADANPGIVAKVSKVFEDCLSGINADTAKAVDLFGSKTGVAPDTLKEAMSSKRLAFNYRPMSDELSATKKSLIFWVVLIVVGLAVYFAAERLR